MSKQDLLKIQTHILKVNLHCQCEGCEHKIKKLLQKIDGVYTVCVDADQGKVVVTGDVDPAKLLKKLKKSGKHAELWGGQKNITYNQNYPINPQFQNSQLENIKGVMKNSQNQKVQKVSGGGGQGQQQHLVAHLQNVKGAHDLKVPSKERKSVKFTLPEEEFYGSDDGSEFDDYDDDYDNEEEEKGYGRGHSQPVHHNNNKMMPVMMGNGRGPQGPPGMVNGPAHKGIAGGGKIGNHESAKRDDFIDMVKQTKGKNGSYGDNYDDYDDEEEGYSRGHSQPVHYHNRMMPMMMGNGRGPQGLGGMVNGPAHKGIVDGGKIGNHGSAKRDDFIDMIKQTKGKSGNYGDNYDDDEEEDRYGHGHGHAKPVHHNNKMMPMVMGNGREPHGPGGMINGLAQKDNGGGGKVGNYGSVKRDDFRDMVMEGKGKSENFGEAKNGDKKGNGDQKGKNNKGEENIMKKDMKNDGGLLGRLLGILGKKSKNGIEASDINMKKNNGGGNNKEKEGMKKGEDKWEGHGNEKKNYSKSKSKHDFDFDDFDFDGLSLDKNGKGSKGSNGNGNVGQMGPMGNNSPMDQKVVQGLMAMNGGGNNGGYYQGMQMQPDPYNIQQQQHMAMMMNQHHQQGNMNNMYPSSSSSSSMMYGRPHPSMNYMPPPPMPCHPMADPITHTFSDENVEGCSIM